MKLYSLQRTQHLPVGISTAWDFFSNPGNLRLITPPWLDFAVTSDLPDTVYPGMIMTYRIRPMLNVAVAWITEITHVREPVFFVDEQRFGPYLFWHHQHIFKGTLSGVEMTDIVHYALPYKALGAVMNRLIVRDKLEEIFDYRMRSLELRFGKLSVTVEPNR